MLLLTFRGFRLAAQNLPRTHDLIAFLQFCEILKPTGAFAYFSRFRPDRPEPHPEGIILLAFLQFYTISKPTDAFRSFSPAAQNPPRTDDFISIPSFL